MIIKTLLNKYSIECLICANELYVIGFGGSIDSLCCKKCNEYYIYTKNTKSLVVDSSYAENIGRFEKLIGKYPGVSSSKVYSPRIIRYLERVFKF